MIDWNFPKNDHGVIGGINESGVETFRGSQVKSLAREICQNSLDARASDEKPVIVEFSKFAVRRANFPRRNTLEEAFNSCIDMWKGQNDKKTSRFFENALVMINETQIHFMRISDSNTTGLTGSKLAFNSNWSNLVKGSGISDKAADAGGSFGIGKSAPYACSALRTVFYSTMDIDGQKASQGVARLVSFRSGDQHTQGQGYYGNTEKNSPIFEQIELDGNFTRDEPGTDVYIAGFNAGTNWRDEIITAIMDGFLMAIFNGFLIVKIDGMEISKETLHDVMSKYQDRASFSLIKEYYNVLTSDNTIPFFENFYSGHIDLKILINNEYHKKIAIARSSGMKLFDKDRNSTLLSFAGILNLRGSEINKIFRSMENPQHDKWEPERFSDNVAYAKQIHADLFQTIKGLIRSLENINLSDEIDAQGLGEYLPEDLSNQDDSPEDKIETISPKPIEIEHIERKPKKQTLDNDMDKDIDAEDSTDGLGKVGVGDELGKGHNQGDSETKGGGAAPGNSSPADAGEAKTNRQIEAKLSHLRLICKSKEKGLYTLIFSAKQDLGKTKISIEYSGEQGKRKAQINSAASEGIQLELNGNEIYLDQIEKDKNYNVEVFIHSDEYFPMEVNIFGYSV